MSNKTNNFLIQGVAYTIIDSDARAAIQTLAEAVDTKNAVFQYATMPTAASTNVGQIVQFVGTTTADYTNGYFYKCVADSQAGTYVWEAISTQDAANIFQVSTTAELEAIEDGQIVQYVGTTTASYTNGHFYTATTESDVKTISEVQVQTPSQTPRLLTTVTTLADLKTQFATAITGFRENHMASLTITADITLDNNCVLTSGTNILFWYDNSAAQVMGVATSSEGVISIKTVVGAGIIVNTINGYKTSSSGEAPEILSAVDTLAELKENLSEVITRHSNGESTFVTFSISTAITLDNGEPIPSNSAVSAYYSNGVPGGVVAYCFTGQAAIKTLQIGSNSGVVSTVNGYPVYNDAVYNEKTSVINIDTLAELKESLAEIYDGSLGDAPKQYSVNTAFASSNGVTIPVNSQLYIFGHKYDDDGYTGFAIAPSGVVYTIVTDYPDATNMVINLYNEIGDLTNLATTAKTDIVSAINELANPPSFTDAVFSVGGTNTSVTLTVNNNTGHAIIYPIARGSSASSSNLYPFYIPKGKSISITLSYLGTCTVNGKILYSADTTATVNVGTWASWVEDKAYIYSWQQNVITDAWTGTTRITLPFTGLSNTGTSYITGTYYSNPFLARFNNPAGYITAYGSAYESITFEVCDRDGNVQATIPSQSTTWSGTVDTTTSCEPLCQGGCVKVTATTANISNMYLQLGPGTQSGGGPQSRFTIHNCMLTYSWSSTPV